MTTQRALNIGTATGNGVIGPIDLPFNMDNPTVVVHGTFTGTLTPQMSVDGGVTWVGLTDWATAVAPQAMRRL